MKIKDVVASKEVANDLSDGKAFYDKIEAGVGDYFWDSLVADIECLPSLHASHRGHSAKKIDLEVGNRNNLLERSAPFGVGYAGRWPCGVNRLKRTTMNLYTTPIIIMANSP